MQVVCTSFQTLDGDFAISTSSNITYCTGFVITLHMVNKVCALFLDQLNRSGGAFLRSSQLKGCVSQCGFGISLTFIELEDVDVVGVNLALVRVGFAKFISAGVVAVFQIYGVLCRNGSYSVLCDFSLIGNNDFIIRGHLVSTALDHIFQISKCDGQCFSGTFISCAISIFSSRDFVVCDVHFNRICNKLQTVRKSIDKFKSVVVVVGHVGHFGGQLKGNGFANLCGGVILIGVTIIGRNLFIHSREGALNLNRSVSAVSGDIHKDSISTTAIVTSRTALREHQIVTSSQAIEVGSAHSLIGIIRNQLCIRIFNQFIKLICMSAYPLLSIMCKSCQSAYVGSFIIFKRFDICNSSIAQSFFRDILIRHRIIRDTTSCLNLIKAVSGLKEVFPSIFQHIAVELVLLCRVSGSVTSNASSKHTDGGHFFAFTLRRIPHARTSYSQAASFLFSVCRKCGHCQAEGKYNSQQHCGCTLKMFHNKVSFHLFFLFLSIFFCTVCYYSISPLSFRLRGTASANSRIPTPNITNIQSPMLPVSGRRGWWVFVMVTWYVFSSYLGLVVV